MPEIRIDSSSSPSRILIVLSICRTAIEIETAREIIAVINISNPVTNNERLECLSEINSDTEVFKNLYVVASDKNWLLCYGRKRVPIPNIYSLEKHRH